MGSYQIINADIVERIRSGEYDAAIHCCNCFQRMGSGVAKALRDAFPAIYDADKKTVWGDYNKLSNFSYVTRVNDNGNVINIYNIYGQFTYGYDANLYLDYDALFLGMKKVKYHLNAKFEYAKTNNNKTVKLLAPKIGAGLAGGDWDRIYTGMVSIFSDFDLTVCEYKP